MSVTVTFEKYSDTFDLYHYGKLLLEEPEEIISVLDELFDGLSFGKFGKANPDNLYMNHFFEPDNREVLVELTGMLTTEQFEDVLAKDYMDDYIEKNYEQIVDRLSEKVRFLGYVNRSWYILMQVIMIANIRVHENGTSSELCQLDLLKFSEEQVRERMMERGFKDEAFFICGFSDWESDAVMTLDEAYQLVLVINGIYSGDDYVVSELVKRRKTITEIINKAYFYLGKDEVQVLKELLEFAEPVQIVDFWCKVITPANAIKSYEEAGYILHTENGFYKNLAMW